jgi:predicted dehydrogenase
MSEQVTEGIGFNRRDFLRGGSVAALMTMLGGVELIAETADSGASDIKFTGVPVKTAIIGLGGWGRELLTGLLTIPEAEVAALCENYPAFLKRAGNLAPKAKQVKDYNAVLSDPEIKAVLIATATHQHKDIALAALKAGKHVYCEAPLANTIEDARAIAVAAKSAKAQVFQSGLQLRCEPHRHFLLPFLRAGATGSPVMVRAQWHKKLSWRASSPNAEREKALNWRLDKNLSTGLAGEIGLHHFDQAGWFLNAMPTAVTGFGAIRFWNQDGREVPDTIQAMFEFPGDVAFHFDATLASSFDASYELFHGSDSTVMIRDNRAWMFQEVDARLQGWEVYASKEKFYKSTGIVLMAGASKSVKTAAVVEEDPENSTVKSALSTFMKNAYDLDLKVSQAKDAFGDDADAIAEQVATVKRRSAPGFLEGYRATVMGILANEAVVGRKRMELKPQVFELAWVIQKGSI